ncbi:MAG TPA: 3-hydroxybutyrate dehydrogenase [Alphaproteobacteria bacterium]|nr:3-hydroxybutyrate dehydrogenase [Alphaproteobacteria bacterium]
MLNKKTALITGSTSGIGLGIAIQLAKQNANIILNGFGSPDEIEKITKELKDLTSGKVLFHGANLMKRNEIEELISFCEKEVGSVDILINNAGIQYVSPVETFPVEKWDQIISLNLSACFHTTQLTLAGMRRKNWGRIINIASAHGLVASAEKSAYVAAKHGVVGLTKSIALETAKSSVTVNAVCPGWVLTPLVEQQIKQKAEQKGITYEQATHDLLSEKQPSLTFATPEQLGDLCVFLCSKAADQITGTALPMDGGWTAQ